MPRRSVKPERSFMGWRAGCIRVRCFNFRKTPAEVVATYPELEPADIQQAMEYAARG